MTISCFLCHAPAKAVIKQIKGHSGYYGCGNRVQKGQWIGKMTFPLVDSHMRTDAQFNENNHLRIFLLAWLPNFPWIVCTLSVSV